VSSGSKLFAYGTVVVLGRLRVKIGIISGARGVSCGDLSGKCMFFILPSLKKVGVYCFAHVESIG